MMYPYFESQMKQFISSLPSDLVDYLQLEYNRSHYQTYYSFFESLLNSLGITGIHILQEGESQFTYFPALGVMKDNIFNFEEGQYLISQNCVSEKQAQIIMANFLLEKFSYLTVNQIKMFQFQNV